MFGLIFMAKEEKQKEAKPGKKFCFKCAAEIFEEAEICPKCGVRQHKSVSTTAKASPELQTSRTSNTSPSRGHVSSGIAIILSFFWPGLGHIYLGDIMFGLFVMFMYAVLWVVAVITALLCSPVPLIVWIWAMYDSYNLAKRINRGEVEE